MIKMCQVSREINRDFSTTQMVLMHACMLSGMHLYYSLCMVCKFTKLLFPQVTPRSHAGSSESLPVSTADGPPPHQTIPPHHPPEAMAVAKPGRIRLDPLQNKTVCRNVHALVKLAKKCPVQWVTL